MGNSVNPSAFDRQKWSKPDGTVTKEVISFLNEMWRRTGSALGIVFAADIAVIPAGSLSSDNVQGALAELDFEKQTKDVTLTGFSALSVTANKVPYGTAPDVFGLLDLDTDPTLAASSDTRIATQKAVSDALGTKAPSVHAHAVSDVTGLTAALAAKADTSSLGTLATQNAGAVNLTGGTIALASGSLGYATGNGGTVTQATDKSTGVTLNKITGEITMNAAALAAGAKVSFTLTNSTAGATDCVIRNHVAGGTIGAYSIEAVAAAGSIAFTVKNTDAGPLSEALVIRFAVIKAATA